MYFDAHSDMFADVTQRRLKGEKRIIDTHHAERLKAGNVEGSIIVMWVDPPHDADHFARTKQIFSCVRDELEEVQSIRFIKSFDDIAKAKAEGKIYAVMGVEGMAYIGSDISRLEDYYALGARHAMLTWNESNSLGHGAATGSTEGLSAMGKEVVRKMQEKNMIVDTSHLNEAGFWDIAKISAKPIIASHSNCKALCDVPRNLTDDQIRAIRDLNGVIGLNSWRYFIDPETPKQNAEHLAHHAAHIIDVAGIDHVGCGFDFFEFLPSDPGMFAGDDSGCEGLEDCTKIDSFFGILRGIGMSKEELDKLAFGNFHRVIKECLG